jgi:integrase
MNWKARGSHYYVPAHAAPAMAGGAPVSGLLTTSRSWPEFWAQIQPPLRARGYRRSSLIVVRQVLRGLARCAPCSPADLTREHTDDYLRVLVRKRSSASWLAMNISLLRTVLDRICGLSLMQNRTGPKRPDTLPLIISESDATTLLGAAASLREVLLLGLLYNCGLKIGEACALKWGDVAVPDATIHTAGSGTSLPRTIPIPEALRTLLHEGASRFPPDAFLFPGRHHDSALSTRMAERIIRRCVRRAGLPRHVTSMTLRHSAAVHALDRGLNIRELQELLGHAAIETTMRYLQCCPPQPPQLPDLPPLPPSHENATRRKGDAPRASLPTRLRAWLRPFRHPPG